MSRCFDPIERQLLIRQEAEKLAGTKGGTTPDNPELLEEVSNLAEFIASCGTDIPYALLAFHPQFYMSDLPTTSRDHAMECLRAARECGLTSVRIGNLHLLSDRY